MRKNILLNKKGVTLLELVIGMALVAIISSTTIMFSKVLSDLSSSVAKSDRDINDLSMFREFIGNWFYSFDSEENYGITSNDSLLFVDANGKMYGVSVDSTEEKIYVEYSEYAKNWYSSEYHLNGIREIKFECYDENRLYKCVVMYNEGDEYSFLLSRRSER